MSAWTKTFPEQSGWYWVRSNKEAEPVCVQVLWNPVSIGSGKIKMVPYVRYPGRKGLLVVDLLENKAEFLGPITSETMETMLDMLRELVDHGECRFDSSGNCHAHWYFGDDQCKHARAKKLLGEMK